MSKQLGTVKFFSDQKGFGFLIPDGGGGDVFVHRTDIVWGKPGPAILLEGQKVHFVIASSAQGKGNGKKAVSVEPVTES